jgi:hypothetical protein
LSSIVTIKLVNVDTGVVKYNGGQACSSGTLINDVAAGNWRMSVWRTNHTGTYRLAMQR